MSNSSTTFRGVPVAVGIDPVRHVARRVFAGVLTPIRFAAFWAAVVFPALYVPLLVDGLSGAETTRFVALLSLHLLALVVGHGHKGRS